MQLVGFAGASGVGGNRSKRMGVLPRLPAESLGNKVAMFWDTGAQVGGGG